MNPVGPSTSEGETITAPHPRGVPARERRQHRLAATADVVLADTVELILRTEPLRLAEVGDHTDAVSEIADALAAVTDRLARDLTATDTDAVSPVVEELHAVRDALTSASSRARHCAAALYARHETGTRAPEP